MDKEQKARVFTNTNIEIVGLLYHRFGEARYPTTNISVELFRQQLMYLKKHQYRVITLSEALEKLYSSSDSGRYVVITIDDAFQSFLHQGWPVLKEYGFKATLFINTETVGSGDYLDWEELRLLLREGVEIGNHTHSHDYFLNTEPTHRYAYLRDDILKAREMIRSELEIDPGIFAYPFGEYDPGMIQVVQEMGFQCAAAQHSGVISSHSNAFALPRFPMTDQYGRMDLFREKINMHPLPVLEVDPENPIAKMNPPILRLRFDEEELDLNRLQCFIQGGDCIIHHAGDSDHVIEITADRKLHSRRHLYTITVPGKKNGEWYWYSFQWVFPGVR